ncbi:hypothetical protein [Psychrobacter sp. AT9]|uniref:hypothetical protein n=1 Tax=Psychrobacter sp. AT9 TaxID=3242893 RepID=UPI0039A5605D
MNYQSFLEMNVLISDPLLLEINQNKFTLILFLIFTAILFYVVANALVRLSALFWSTATTNEANTAKGVQ